jgi:outer membrane protein OmpA-like peptidoglycan-associated protein
MKFCLTILFSLLCSAVFSQKQFSIFFDSDKFDPTPKEMGRLSQWITANGKVKIVGIYGFTDEDGTSGYNDTLAQKRINTVMSLVRGKVKTRDDFKTRSFGELHVHSKTKAENRKVTLFYLEEADLPRENEILGIKEKPKPTPVPKVTDYPEKMVFENPDGSKTEYKMDVEFMKKVSTAQVGEKVKVENLNFKINTFIVVPESRGKMYELLTVLKSNPSMKVEIQGHLCCMPVDRLDLSTQRAKAINNFLVANGIDGERLTYKGFGSTQPIFAIPEKDEPQRAANRRVEILIVAN